MPKAEQHRRPREGDLTARRGPAPAILLVDSYDDSRRALADLLGECGYQVLEARSGVEGLRLAAQRRPGLVIVDLWPFFSASMQMIERLHRGLGPSTVPVLILTSAVGEQYRERAAAAQCAAYLEKPCPPEVVLREVSGILAGAEPVMRQGGA